MKFKMLNYLLFYVKYILKLVENVKCITLCKYVLTLCMCIYDT